MEERKGAPYQNYKKTNSEAFATKKNRDEETVCERKKKWCVK
jgi:hypothetical protein